MVEKSRRLADAQRAIHPVLDIRAIPHEYAVFGYDLGDDAAQSQRMDRIIRQRFCGERIEIREPLLQRLAHPQAALLQGLIVDLRVGGAPTGGRRIGR